MPMVIYSPYSGNPVKVRDQDINRALRDEEGRIFYVVERSDGEGYYASPTRKGSEKEEQRYLEMITKSAGAERRKQAVTPAHDATGPGRAGAGGRLVWLVVLLIILIAVAYGALAYTGYLPEAIPNVLPGASQQQEQDETPANDGDQSGSNNAAIIHASAPPFGEVSGVSVIELNIVLTERNIVLASLNSQEFRPFAVKYSH